MYKKQIYFSLFKKFKKSYSSLRNLLHFICLSSISLLATPLLLMQFILTLTTSHLSMTMLSSLWVPLWASKAAFHQSAYRLGLVLLMRESKLKCPWLCKSKDFCSLSKYLHPFKKGQNILRNNWNFQKNLQFYLKNICYNIFYFCTMLTSCWN